ncbi:MAG: hypothetical protein M1335_03910 [Chloroflexi bacterium]|nr:hypothetical protein [Chloroflexota bacterium]
MSAVVSTATPVARRRSQSSPWRDAWRRYRHNRMALIGGVIASMILLTAIFAPVIAPYSYSFPTRSSQLFRRLAAVPE